MIAFHLKKIDIILGVSVIYNEFYSCEKIRFQLKKNTNIVFLSFAYLCGSNEFP